MTNNEQAITSIETMANNVMALRQYYHTDKDIYAEVDNAAQDAENALRKLAEKMLYYNPDAHDVMTHFNAHNPDLVRAINDAWKDAKYHNSFSEILIALSQRYHEAFEDKFGIIVEADGTWAMEHANKIMEGVCDDEDLKTILSFVGYTRK